jgi:hypothetical protein
MAPNIYFAKVKDQVNQGVLDISTIDKEQDLYSNLLNNDMPTEVFNYTHLDYNSFLMARRKLMAKRIKQYYESL